MIQGEDVVSVKQFRHLCIRLVVLALVAGSTAVAMTGFSLVTAAPASAAAALQCDQNTLYATDSSGEIYAIDITTHASTPVTTVSPTNNGLGIASQGLDAYAFQNGGNTLAHYDTRTGKVTTFSNVLGSNATVIRGAVNPATGIYYYGANGTSAPLYAWNANTDTNIGRVGDITGLTNLNGDFAFSSRGLLFVVTGNEVRRVDTETVPKTAGSTQLTTSLVATLPSATNSPGIAFSSDGYLYVSTGTSIIKLDPASGAQLDSWTIGGDITPTDLASCNYPNTIAVKTNVVGRAHAGDQFSLSVTGGQITSGNTATTTGTATGVQADKAGAALTIPGRTYTVTETASGTTNLNDYASAYECIDLNSNDVVASGVGTSGEFVFPEPTSDEGIDVDCIFTNTPAALTMTKSVTPTTITEAGTRVDYSFVVKNTGGVALNDVAINETTFSGTGPAPVVTCPSTSLAVSATMTCTASYTATQADVDAGVINNTATATGAPTGGSTFTSDPSVAKVTATQSPAIGLVESVDKTKLVEGQTATYTMVATNTGNVTLHNVAIAEGDSSGTGDLSALACTPTQPATLAPGDAVTCTATYAITQDDVDAGTLHNTATAAGTPPTGPAVTAGDAVDLPSDRDPGLALTMRVTQVGDADHDGATDKGDTIDYAFDLTNTGNVTLKDVEIDDPKLAAAGIGITCAPSTLKPGEQVTCTADAPYVITQADVDAGKVHNTATATATPPTGTTLPPVAPSSTDTPTDAKPTIALVESVDRTKLVVGQQATYTLVATNTGNVTLHDVTVAEGDFSGSGHLSALVCTPAQPSTLAPGEELTCTATYTVTQGDLDSGALDNTTTVSATSPGGTDVSDVAHASIAGDRDPGLSVVKRVKKVDDLDHDDATDTGDTIDYVFDVTNTGNVTIANVAIDDPMLAAAGVAVSCAPAPLSPGETVTCTAAPYVITQHDTDAGNVRNTATATGTPPSGTALPTVGPSSTETPTDQDPAIGLIRTVDKTQLVAGEKATYTTIATNTGNVTLHDVTVAEGDFSGSGALSTLDCTPAQPATLAPGEAVTCTATYTVSQDDVDAGTLQSSVTAAGMSPSGADVAAGDEVSLPSDRHPEIALLKSANVTSAKSGQTITYTYVVTNTGNVTLTNPKVTETRFTGHGKLSAIRCPSTSTRLAPGKQEVCTATYVVTDADVTAGSITSAATATGTPPAGLRAPVSAPSTVTVAAQQNAFRLAARAKVLGSTHVVAGDKVRYRITVANRGPDAAKGPITVREKLPKGLKLVKASGAGWTCTVAKAKRIVTCTTRAGIAAGHTATPVTIVTKATKAAIGHRLKSVATASAHASAGAVVSTASTKATVKVTALPKLPDTGFRVAAPLAARWWLD
jgi:uncharacterized repeat protein (TIGR01451 family)